MNHKYLSLFNLFIVTIAVNIGFTLGDIHCFCNTANCIRNSYTCKSSGEYASCYTEIDDKQSHFNAYKHGCIEHLSDSSRLICEKHVNKSKHKLNYNPHDDPHNHHSHQSHHHQHHHHQSHHHQHQVQYKQQQQVVDATDDDDPEKLINQNRKSKLLYLRLNERKTFNRNNDNYKRKRNESKKRIICCISDMCNYLSNVEMNVKIQSKINPSQKGAIVAKNRKQANLIENYRDENENGDGVKNATDSVDDNDLWWFNLAVIVVPIVGGIVLVLLILFAAQVLRQDKKRQRYLHDLYRKNNLLQSEFIFYNNYLLNSDSNGNSKNSVNSFDEKKLSVNESNYNYFPYYYYYFNPVNENADCGNQLSNNLNNNENNISKDIEKYVPFTEKDVADEISRKQLKPLLTTSKSTTVAPNATTHAAEPVTTTANGEATSSRNQLPKFIGRSTRARLLALFRLSNNLNKVNKSSV